MKRGGTKQRASSAVAADYLELVREFPLRPIKTDREYAAAAVLDRLAVRTEGTLSRSEQDYLDTPTMLVQVYDDRHFKIAEQPTRPRGSAQR